MQEALSEIIIKVILNKWQWNSVSKENIELLISWVNAHELLLICLDRVVLEDLDREELEDEYLYRLPLHARPS